MSTETRKATKGWRGFFGLEDEINLELERLQPGMRVRYAYPNNGYDYQIRIAAEHLTLGKIYTVKSFIIDTWHTDIWLEGFKTPFNSVMFTEVLHDYDETDS